MHMLLISGEMVGLTSNPHKATDCRVGISNERLFHCGLAHHHSRNVAETLWIVQYLIRPIVYMPAHALERRMCRFVAFSVADMRVSKAPIETNSLVS